MTGIRLNRSSVRQRAALTLVASALVLSLSGCKTNEPEVSKARGTVRLSDGSPLVGAWVSFRPSTGKSRVAARGQVQPNGEFILSTFNAEDGAIVGGHQAIVTMPLGGDREGAAASANIDQRYANYDTSGLNFTVSDEHAKNQFDIVVELSSLK